MSASFNFNNYRSGPDPSGVVARVVPGIEATARPHRRKGPQSVYGDGSHWTPQAPKTDRPNSGIPENWWQVVVPRPWLGAEGLQVVAQLSADFLSVIGTYMVVTSLMALPRYRGIAWSGRSPVWAEHWGWLLLYAALFTLLGHSEGLYGPNSPSSLKQERLVIIKGTLWATALLAITVYLAHSGRSALPVPLFNAPFGLLAMFAWREWRNLRASRTPEGTVLHRRVLVLGAGSLGRKAAERVVQNSRGRSIVCGFIDDEGPRTCDLLGTPHDLARIARAEFVDEVIVAIPHRPDLARMVVREAQRNHLDVSVAPDLFGFEPVAELRTSSGDRVPLIKLHEERIPVYGLLLKRAVDVLFSAAGLVVLCPVFIVIAAAIKLGSKGPVLYRAFRTGQKGTKFRCWKFRTMVADADSKKDDLRSRNERSGPFFKVAADPRITCIGRFLRRYSLDELPQLWNVLRGDMSLVGPRPHPLDDVKGYQLPDLRRLDAKPGMTGLWQVTARHDPSFQRNVDLDVEYIERWGLWMDLRVLFMTLRAVLQGNGT